MVKKSAIFLGTKPAASIALQYLIDKGWHIEAVVTPSVDPHPWISGVKVSEVAQKNDIPLFYEQKILNNMCSNKVDLVISYMYRNLVKKETLNKGKIAALNFHPAPLPYYGGWAFYNVAILENVTSYGPTCHYMDEGFDTGPILKVDSFKIDAKKETAVSLERKTQIRMLHLFKEVIGMVENGQKLPITDQVETEMRYFNKKQFEALKKIPIDADPETIERFSRAFWYPPYRGAYMELNSNLIELIPEIVKNNIAYMYHADDYTALKGII